MAQPDSAPSACGILPPYLLRTLAARTSQPEVARAARHTIAVQRTLHGQREIRSHRPRDRARPGPPGFVPDRLRTQPPPRPPRSSVSGREPVILQAPDRSVYDAQNLVELPGVLRRREGEGPHADESVNEVYDGLGATWRLFNDVYGRNSLDGQGLPLLASVHFEERYDNAFWDGRQMVFGDGDGKVFSSFTDSVDVIGHELAHGFTQYTAGFVYVGQSGALNEHVSDVFGVLTAQHLAGEDARETDWLVGKALFMPQVQGRALRSMIEPGTAYDDPELGKDPQPASMADYVELPHDEENDNGGVHINSGIPNRAFALSARAIGGPAWESVGRVWYDVMTTAGLPRDTDFAAFAQATKVAARERFGENSTEAEAVDQGWSAVAVEG